jgi:hypothetical protein
MVARSDGCLHSYLDMKKCCYMRERNVNYISSSNQKKVKKKEINLCLFIGKKNLKSTF